MAKKRALSGIQPSGKLHLGNLLGALENWAKLQSSYESFFFIADFHALTTGYADTSKLKENIFDIKVDMLSVGLDPEKSTLPSSSTKNVSQIQPKSPPTQPPFSNSKVSLYSPGGASWQAWRSL